MKADVRKQRGVIDLMVLGAVIAVLGTSAAFVAHGPKGQADAAADDVPAQTTVQEDIEG